LPCGEKVRRGGPQETVRLTVLIQLSRENPVWTLEDAIEHLSGKRPSSQCDDQDLSDGDDDDDVKSGTPLADEPHCCLDVGRDSASQSPEMEEVHTPASTPGTLSLNQS